MRYFPIFMDIQKRPVLVIGGGEVACRKIDMLLQADADITVVAPSIKSYLMNYVEEDKIHYIKGFYHSDLLAKQSYVQVWATTDNSELNHQVYRDAHDARILVNVVDDTPHCDFITPSMVNRGRVQVAISSGGSSPVLIRMIREQMETQLSSKIAMLADFGADKRNVIKQHFMTVDERRKFWETFLRSPEVEKLTTRNELEQLFSQYLSSNIETKAERNWIEYHQETEMLTLKSLRLMQQAEWVICFNDCPSEFVELCRRDAERLYVDTEQEIAEYLHQAEVENIRVTILLKKGHLLRNATLQAYLSSDIYVPTL
ncbi:MULTISPECIES: precorrin-2 dehydrogenase/sirohydrochlorin ferrochelatase family protein [Aliivibrio]|uniref:precorrin-2 dehydrogenase n=1 Tax=Aliivibrio finisterrensis TaxID=511998 RepID=A0A4Q5KYG5_9GAMM|nr:MULTISPECIES: NAD(P)-dependent oxidoreductase [Aliivibrio]MDD9177767.1 NAD(P)-dependent oxidoreductase [Aliivibrio sp. A6]RYU50268.1 siroheme synthase [Aliivibrio finisterrensis]RYU51883.1 siroheme synthase [Aliivibrio finisterrensis]RYU55995.1 siroheme synthase [Aliivibrio finisterrensis]RYU64720.1 siroheme synthase [Aliivibrio finisterrensis]